ncbi:hypothetical protein BC829DRAFT_442059 [Chytridium lagenaria]|nr:hypothetical protein BC829DRAFT_442059 [Chytridium lagenaria]
MPFLKLLRRPPLNTIPTFLPTQPPLDIDSILTMPHPSTPWFPKLPLPSLLRRHLNPSPSHPPLRPPSPDIATAARTLLPHPGQPRRPHRIRLHPPHIPIDDMECPICSDPFTSSTVLVLVSTCMHK